MASQNITRYIQRKRLDSSGVPNDAGQRCMGNDAHASHSPPGPNGYLSRIVTRGRHSGAYYDSEHVDR